MKELENFSAIRDYLDELELNLSAKFYRIRQPKYTLAEAKRRDTTYSIRIYTKVQLLYLNDLNKTTENDVIYIKKALVKVYEYREKEDTINQSKL